MKLFTIEENDAEQRLDKFLKKLLPSATLSLIYKCIRKDKIKVKSGRIAISWEKKWQIDERFRKQDNEYKLLLADQIKIFVSDEEFETLSVKTSSPEIRDESQREVLKKTDIVYEDEYILILNKNPAMNVHPGDHKTKESNVIAQVQDYLWEHYNSLTFKPSLVHRIDRDTSGALIIAKRKDILVRLVEDFKSHTKIDKTYYALVFGKLSRPTWSIRKNLKRIENAKNENKVQVSESGQTAVSHYKKIAEYTIKTSSGEIFITSLAVTIETGRMHQIRVHMAALGNPVVGDKTYGDKKLNSFLSRNYDLSRQALHAWKIGFFHYGKNKSVTYTARLKPDMEEFIKKITK